MTPARLRVVHGFLVGFPSGVGFAEPELLNEPTASPERGTPAVTLKARASTATIRPAPADPGGDVLEGDAVGFKPDRRINLQLGGISVAAGYTRSSGFAAPPLSGRFGAGGYRYGGNWGTYDLLGWSPFGNPLGLYGGFGQSQSKGQVKLKVGPKTAGIGIEGGYAGSVQILKGSVWLELVACDLCFKGVGHQDYCRHICVLSGKNPEVLAKLPPVAVEVGP